MTRRSSFELLNEPSFLQNIGDRGVRSLDDARAYIAKGPRASYAQLGFGLFHVSLRETGEAIGMCGLLKRDWLEDVDVGFAFLPAFWGKGYAYESSVGRDRVGAADAGDHARRAGLRSRTTFGSIAVLEKLGMRYSRDGDVAGGC